MILYLNLHVHIIIMASYNINASKRLSNALVICALDEQFLAHYESLFRFSGFQFYPWVEKSNTIFFMSNIDVQVFDNP